MTIAECLLAVCSTNEVQQKQTIARIAALFPKSLLHVVRNKFSVLKFTSTFLLVTNACKEKLKYCLKIYHKMVKFDIVNFVCQIFLENVNGYYINIT